MHYPFETFKFTGNLNLWHSSNRSPSVTSFETLIVDWFISHMFTCRTTTEQVADRVTIVGLKMASNSNLNIGDKKNNQQINISNEVTLGLHLDDCKLYPN